MELDEALDYQASTFPDAINSSGLSRPSEYTFILTVHSWHVYEEITSSIDLKSQVVGVSNQRFVFGRVMDRTTIDQ